MAAKKSLTLLFCLFLVALLFYSGINLAEQGSKNLLGVDEPLKAFRITAREGGELEIYWSGSSRIFDISFLRDGAASLREGLRSLVGLGPGERTGEE